MFRRTQFTRLDGQRFRCSWWQFGSRIFRYREYLEGR
jgi:hypothetical protein